MLTTLADVLRTFGPAYLREHNLRTREARAWRAINPDRFVCQMNDLASSTLGEIMDSGLMSTSPITTSAAAGQENAAKRIRVK